MCKLQSAQRGVSLSSVANSQRPRVPRAGVTSTKAAHRSQLGKGLVEWNPGEACMCIQLPCLFPVLDSMRFSCRDVCVAASLGVMGLF